MFENANNYANNFGMGTGYQYSPNSQQAVSPYKSWLTQDEIQNLTSNQSKRFSLEITDDERMKAICNHRNADGSNDTLISCDDGESVRCQICGSVFKPIDLNTDTVNDICSAFIDIIETVKLYAIDIPPATAREFFQIIAVAKKVPGFVKVCLDNFEAHSNYNPYRYNTSNADAFNVFHSIINGSPIQGQPNPYFGYQQNQQFNNGFNPQFGGFQNNGYQQPQYNPGMAPVQPNANSNGFGYNGPAAPQNNGYQPTTTGFQLNGQQPQQQTTTQQPNQQQTAQTKPNAGKTVEVNQNFK